YLTATLAARRDKIGRTFFSKVLPLDNFRIENGELHFDDLAVQYNFRSVEQYTMRWSRLDNGTGRHEVLVGTSTKLPIDTAGAPAGTYFAALIKSTKVPAQTVTVYIRKEQSAFSVVGIDRTWSRQTEVINTGNQIYASLELKVAGQLPQGLEIAISNTHSGSLVANEQCVTWQIILRRFYFRFGWVGRVFLEENQ